MEWSGPIIAIETFVEADIQQSGLSGIVDSPRLDISNPTRVSRQHLVVGSPFLAQGLSEIVQYYPSFHQMIFYESIGGGLRIQEPFAVLFHHFDSIEAMAERNTAVTICKSEHGGNAKNMDLTKYHMQHLMEFLRPIYQECILTYQRNISDSVPQVAFDMIWYLLKPGADVYVQVDESTHAAVVMDVKPNGVNQSDVWGAGAGDVKWWLVDVWRLETDGSRLRRGLISAKVHAYSGLREVTSLPVCLVSIWDKLDGGERRRHILRRSATFFKALHQGNLLADYNGPIKETNSYYTGKVVIDHRRGLGSPNHQRPNSSYVKDYSIQFQEYDDIHINKDPPFYNPAPTDTTEPPPADTAKDEAIARLEKLILDDRLAREAKEARARATIERAAEEASQASWEQPNNKDPSFPTLPHIDTIEAPPVDPAKDEAITRLENLIVDERTERGAKEAARLAFIKREVAENAVRERQLAHDRTEDARQRSRSNDADIDWATPKLPNAHEHQDTESPGLEPRVRIVSELTEHQLLLLCPDALAYALGNKQWILLSLDYIQESVPSDESISNLVIGPDELRTIQALSNRQNSKTGYWSADFIEGKGLGQIILLHGPPGVGKTYTVEAISEWLHRPLLSLTVADIGTVETLVEGQLMTWFNLAEAWNAVLLVDEADIFLERRQNRDLARNGLVSAFLRQVEYFKGLLFLTTNRVGQIDDAFISRIHIAIGYEQLNEETRRRVWNGFFQKLRRERKGKIQIDLDAKKWILNTTGETQLNGRDIRNALQTAITLAEFGRKEDPDYDAEDLTIVNETHFQKVLEMSNRFRNYVTSIRREDEQKRAQGRGDRNDYRRGIANEMGGGFRSYRRCATGRNQILGEVVMG
ncbi:hypothetical protein N7533_009615 [Penicillium manginii]|uniref:uncharacterized protein n=1 Tax=Penicillium manginii TaxID=203109 RepID=UPI0025471C0D|nr:uncharacterized protein N7533_009615 [Penicillium manginii]KAJ5744745.1 hypothetical protein N7533_009615 [Penicillium manginii]